MLLRVILAGLLGGIAMFAWTGVAHMALPLGEIGVRQIENEAPLLAAMQESLGDREGLYIFPSWGVTHDAAPAEKQAAMEAYPARLAANPSGILVYHPPGAEMMNVRLFGVEFAADVAVSLIAAWLVAAAALTSFFGRVLFVAGVGLAAVLTTNVSYWNWYGFPTDYTLSYIATDWIAYVVAGIVIALVFAFGGKKKEAPAAA